MYMTVINRIIFLYYYRAEYYYVSVYQETFVIRLVRRSCRVRISHWIFVGGPFAAMFSKLFNRIKNKKNISLPPHVLRMKVVRVRRADAFVWNESHFAFQLNRTHSQYCWRARTFCSVYIHSTLNRYSSGLTSLSFETVREYCLRSPRKKRRTICNIGKYCFFFIRQFFIYFICIGGGGPPRHVVLYTGNIFVSSAAVVTCSHLYLYIIHIICENTTCVYNIVRIPLYV